MELISRAEVLDILKDICNHGLKVYDKKYHLPIITITSTMELNVLKGFMKCTYKYCPDCGSYNVHDLEKGAE